jgi:hypothetical protein
VGTTTEWPDESPGEKLELKRKCGEEMGDAFFSEGLRIQLPVASFVAGWRRECGREARKIRVVVQK